MIKKLVNKFTKREEIDGLKSENQSLLARNNRLQKSRKDWRGKAEYFANLYGDSLMKQYVPMRAIKLNTYKMIVDGFDDEDLIRYSLPMVYIDDDNIKWSLPKSAVDKAEMFEILRQRFGVIMPWNE